MQPFYCGAVRSTGISNCVLSLSPKLMGGVWGQPTATEVPYNSPAACLLWAPDKLPRVLI